MVLTKSSPYSQAEISQYVKTVLALGTLEEILQATTGLYSKKQLLDSEIYSELANLAHKKILEYDPVLSWDTGKGLYFIPVLMVRIPEYSTEGLKSICKPLANLTYSDNDTIPMAIQVYFDAVHEELERRHSNV
ncbi:hypothetical protein EP56_15135 [Listeriaceae bacterium FSL A5-0209]|nr:hypothetical protein EP56_15135 [Listeriaceae bacterium FSL A5-0209]